LGLLRGYFEVTVVLLWDHFGATLGILWGHFGCTLGAFVWATLGSFFGGKFSVKH
jgi:hypothetical protein